MKKGFKWLCEHCGAIVYDEELSRLAQKDSPRVIERGRKGNLLYYCGEACCLQHRGKMAGENRIYGAIAPNKNTGETNGS